MVTLEPLFTLVVLVKLKIAKYNFLILKFVLYCKLFDCKTN